MGAYLVQFVNLLIIVLNIAMIARVLSSWLRIGPCSPFFPVIRIIYQVTEPILAPIRRVLPTFGMLDFSPMVALILLSLIQRVLLSVLQ